MSLASRVSLLLQLRPPVLTAYLDVNPANPRNQGTPRGYVTWIRSRGRALAKELPSLARKSFLRQLRRITDYLQSEEIRSRGLILFAGPRAWEAIRLQVAVIEELHWGKPSLQQILWLLDEHRPRGAVLIDSSSARFFRFWLGTVTEDIAEVLSLDRSSWRKPYLVGPSRPGVAKQHGVQRDRVSDRMAAHRKRFTRELANRIISWAGDGQIGPVVLVGRQNDIEAVAEFMPEQFRSQTVLFPKAMSHISVHEAQQELEPELTQWEREYEAVMVKELIRAQDSDRAVTGLKDTLENLQKGRVRELIVTRGLNAKLRQCVNCGWLERSSELICPLCGSDRQPRTLRTAIPELAVRHKVPVEVVAGQAARKLRDEGGIGAWLQRARKVSHRRVGAATGS